MQAKEIEIYYTGNETVSNTISTPNDAYNVFMRFWDKQINYRESVYILYLDRKNQVKFYQRHTTGSTSASIIDVKQIFATALKTASEGFIIAHNHPSGNLKASYADRKSYEKLLNASEFMDIKCIDFMIVTENSHLSLRE